MYPHGFLCSCSSFFRSEEDRDTHLREERDKYLHGQQLKSSILQSIEGYLSHSKAENLEVLGEQNNTTSQRFTTHDEQSLAKHKNTQGFLCPREECDSQPVYKLAGLRNHYGTRKILTSFLTEQTHK